MMICCSLAFKQIVSDVSAAEGCTNKVELTHLEKEAASKAKDQISHKNVHPAEELQQATKGFSALQHDMHQKKIVVPMPEPTRSMPAMTVVWSPHPSKCLDVSYGSTKNGANVQIWDCEQGGHPNMEFLVPTGTCSGPIRWAKHPEKCLDLQEQGTDNGNPVISWDCEDNKASQQWNLPCDQPFGFIKWAEHPNKCIDVSHGATCNGVNVQIWECVDDHPNQQWKILPEAGVWLYSEPNGGGGRFFVPKSWFPFDICQDPPKFFGLDGVTSTIPLWDSNKGALVRSAQVVGNCNTVLYKAHCFKSFNYDKEQKKEMLLGKFNKTHGVVNTGGYDGLHHIEASEECD